MIEILIMPEWRRVRRRGVQEERVFSVGDLRGGEEESVDPDAVDGTFAILTGGGAHKKPAFGDGDEQGLDGGIDSDSLVQIVLTGTGGPKRFYAGGSGNGN
jgi:hypothetical protein